MDTSWDKIQEALTAAIRGDEMPPVVSQRTLFGIPSTVEVQMAKFAAELAYERAVSQGGGASTDDRAQSEAGSSGDDAVEAALRKWVKAAACEMGADALIGRGMRYFIFAGREAGFDIPAYPFDPKGELKDFLAERGVRNLPGYYAGLGIPQDRYEDVQTHALLVLHRPDGPERGVLLRGAEYCDATRFVSLCESRFLDLCDADALRSVARELHVNLPSSASR